MSKGNRTLIDCPACRAKDEQIAALRALLVRAEQFLDHSLGCRVHHCDSRYPDGDKCNCGYEQLRAEVQAVTP